MEADYQINIPEPIGAPLAIKFRDKNNKTFLDCAMKENRVDLIEKLFKIPGIGFDFRPITSGVTRKNKIINVTTYVNEPSMLIPLDIETSIFEPLQDFFDLFTSKNKIERIDINSFIEKFVYNDVDGTIRYKANMELDIEDINKNFDIIYIAQNFINILYNYGQIDIVFPVPDTIGIPLITNFKDINDETFLYKAVKEKDADLVKKLLKVSGIDINAKSKLTGETALHTAISKKCSNISIMLLRYYGIDVNKIRTYFIWDRDPKSNNDEKIVRNLIKKFGNSMDNGEEMNGLLLLSYPAIESYVISNFENDILRKEIGHLKSYVKEKGYKVKNMNRDTIKLAVTLMHKVFKSFGIKNYSVDSFSKTSLKLFDKEEQCFKDGEKYRLLSLISIIFIDLGIITEK